MFDAIGDFITTAFSGLLLIVGLIVYVLIANAPCILVLGGLTIAVIAVITSGHQCLNYLDRRFPLE